LKAIFFLALFFSFNTYACRTDSISIVRNTSLSLKKKEGKLKSMLSQDQVFGLPFSYLGKRGCVDRTGKLSSVVIKTDDKVSREVVVGFPETKFKKIKGRDHHFAILDSKEGVESLHLLTVTCVEQEVLFADSIVLNLIDLQKSPARDLESIQINMMIATGAAAHHLSSHFKLSDIYSSLLEVNQSTEFSGLDKPSVITSSSIRLPGQSYFSVSSSMAAKDLCQTNNLKNLEQFSASPTNPSFANSRFNIEYKNNLLLIN